MSEEFIGLSVPNLKGNELKYVTNAIETEWVSTAGPYVTQFEEKIAEYVHTDCAVSCQSGTAGLHTALIVCDVKPGDLVIAPTLTFIAAVNPIKYVGADPVFMDCDDSLCIDPVRLKEFCETECELRESLGDSNGKVLVHKVTGRRVSAMILVHVFGNMADIESIKNITDEYGIKLIEDATEAIGTYYTSGKYKGRYAGTIGDVGVYSFNGNKIITTGGGGMIVSSDNELLAHAKHLTTQAKSDEALFYHDEIGYNYRMTNIQAALGLAQLEQLEDFIEIKRRNYELYKELLADEKGVKILPFSDNARSNHWFYSLILSDEYKFDKFGLINHLKSAGIQSRPIWGLISDQKPYEGALCYKVEKARYYWQRVVNLPCSTNLSEEDVKRVVKQITGK